MAKNLFSVAMLIPRLEPSDNGVFVGGHVASLRTLCMGQTRMGQAPPTVVTSLHRNKFTLFDTHRPAWGHFEVFKNNFRPQSSGFGLFFILRTFFFALCGRLRRFDIVHGHSGYAVYAWATYLASKVSGAAGVHSVYCPLEKTTLVRGRRKSRFMNFLSRIALNKLDRVLAMSKNVATSLLESGVAAQKVTVIPPAIDTDVFHPSRTAAEMRNKLGVPEDGIMLLYVGNLLPSKGLDILAKSFVRVTSQTPNVYLVVTTELKDPEFENRLEAVNAIFEMADVEAQVKFLGTIHDMPGLMASADMLVVPYRDTQGPSDYPIAMMEAMACAKPVVGTCVGGIPELIGDDERGWLAIPDNVEHLADRIEQALSAPEERERRGIEGRTFICSHFSLARVHSLHAEVYGKIKRRA